MSNVPVAIARARTRPRWIDAVARTVFFILASVQLVPAQVGPPVRPLEFDVASVKLQPEAPTGPGFRVAADGLRARSYSLKDLIAYTYGYPPDRILAGPGWLESNRYEIIGRTNQSGATTPMVKEMIKALLADRFQLRAHTESRPASVFALIIARRDGRLGPSLKPSTGCQQGRVVTGASATLDGKNRACGTRTLVDRGLATIEAGGAPISELVWALGGATGNKVVDKTGLSGLFDFDLKFTLPWTPGRQLEPGDIPEVFTAVREQLGLELKSEPGSVDVLVIDDVQLPTAN